MKIDLDKRAFIGLSVIRNRLTKSEMKKANMLASMIDCSPHEWPKSSHEIRLICHGYLDRVADNQALRERLAAVEAERDAARAREARAVEALWKYRSAQRRMLDKWADGDNAVKTELWRGLHDCEKLADAVLCQAQPALDAARGDK